MRFTRFDQLASSEFTNEVAFYLSEWHLAECPEPSPAFEDIALLVYERDVRGLCLYDLYPEGNEITYLHLRQVLAFFQKRSDIDIGVDTKAAAWQTFKGTELRCFETNELLRKYSRGGFFFHPRVESVLFQTQRKISAILGDLPPLEDIRLRFGPGATTQVKKKDASVRRKLAQAFSVSEDAIRFLPDLLAEVPLWAQVGSGTTVHDVLVHQGKVDFVRKTAKTDRTICVEPMLNGLVQLGIGDYIARRLRRQGVDLRDQTVNQRLARKGSLDGSLATLDLSSASDLIAKGLVETLLPFEWWDFLRAFRTEEVLTPEGPMRLEKFSSMGNGFTFALESLIFFCLAKASQEVSGPGAVSVYGDDIIVPVAAVPLLVEVLTACGLTVNSKKSFWEGPFRESCGKDYFSGINVRPSYVKDALSCRDIFKLHNHYVGMFWHAPAEFLASLVDESCALWGPARFGDGHLHLSDEDEVLRPHNREVGWSGYTFETYTMKSPKRFYRLGADYVYPSYSAYMRDPGDLFVDGGSNTGVLRPEFSQSRYGSDRFGRFGLEDTLPGVSGYKRIKIYTLR